MDAVITGVCVGSAMLLINSVVFYLKKRREKRQQEAVTTQENQTRIDALERTTDETRELVKCTLQTCIILGDGMIQNGINGDFRKAFCEKKQEVFKLL